jgi:hypothetical protein
LLQAVLLTWGIPGAQPVPCFLENDAREGVMLIACTSGVREKLPLTLIQKGKTERWLQGVKPPGESLDGPSLPLSGRQRKS